MSKGGRRLCFGHVCAAADADSGLGEGEDLRAARLRREQLKNTTRAGAVFGPEMKGVAAGFCLTELEMVGTIEATTNLYFWGNRERERFFVAL
ncbi:hypothetical protein NC653_002467 [Populus alba x Populus x berolinensis]|uniref:Uncharacterized protein n=1 Tax=Populus alba x Populus x berolinensis TaxID=444605 RepID=A0AAD6WHX1_9ROSI|nr:hypothetical protein NC653_002467 [Populus alba x Populus x berolinensis]